MQNTWVWAFQFYKVRLKALMQNEMVLKYEDFNSTKCD
ncbi:MAG: hypothetical protein H6Q14_1235 [Bacteroidetes bacterium]|nr:hypothetical protein [Bacteroidota bacterium]